MSDGSEEEQCEECESGAPAWMATFADLMSLLMCFFVLLLSFSEMDLQKYKQVAGSMKLAFGVQREVKADDSPKADSFIKQEFSPGRAEPTVLKVMQSPGGDQRRDVPDTSDLDQLVAAVEATLAEEIAAEAVELGVHEDGIMIRVREQDAFPSGSAALQSGFKPVLEKLVEVLNDSRGHVTVSGHTDDVPIATRTFASNWVLSSARAASVVHHLASSGLDDPSRIELRAYADTRPLMPNVSTETRARNRRVEIDIRLGG